MLRQILERTTGPLTNSQFAEVMDLTTLDIKVNRIGYNVRTSLNYAVQVAEIIFRLLSR